MVVHNVVAFGVRITDGTIAQYLYMIAKGVVLMKDGQKVKDVGFEEVESILGREKFFFTHELKIFLHDDISCDFPRDESENSIVDTVSDDWEATVLTSTVFWHKEAENVKFGKPCLSFGMIYLGRIESDGRWNSATISRKDMKFLKTWLKTLVEQERIPKKKYSFVLVGDSY